MGLRWQDVTLPMRSGMMVWPGDPAFEISPLRRIAAGGGCNTSHLSFCTHTGTHIDAPWHFDEGGKRLDAVDCGLFFGDALLIASDADLIGASDLPRGRLPSRVLFKTRNSEQSADGPFRTDFVALDTSAAERLVSDGVGLVGVDGPSVAPYKQAEQETHHRLLDCGIVVVEGLRLKGLASGTYAFVVLPLPLQGADGAPCRAFIGVEEATT